MESIHSITSRSYLVYLLFFLPAIVLDLFWPLELFSPAVRQVGGALLLCAPFLLHSIHAAAAKFRRIRKDQEVSADMFMYGPYRITRTPTQLALMMLFGGFALFANLPFLFLATLFSYLFTKATFMVRMEAVLERKYGQAYRTYKKRIGNIL
jgi:protein-S-isoprenylcysteine O-methyltransferase Ste14